MATMMMFHVPEDPGLLAAFGEVALRHEHLSHILRMTIKTFAGVEVNEALDATAFDGASMLRERVRKLAKQRLGEGQALVKGKGFVVRRGLKEAQSENAGRRTGTGYEVWYVRGEWARDHEALHRQQGRAL